MVKGREETKMNEKIKELEQQIGKRKEEFYQKFSKSFFRLFGKLLMKKTQQSFFDMPYVKRDVKKSFSILGKKITLN